MWNESPRGYVDVAVIRIFFFFEFRQFRHEVLISLLLYQRTTNLIAWNNINSRVQELEISFTSAVSSYQQVASPLETSRRGSTSLPSASCGCLYPLTCFLDTTSRTSLHSLFLLSLLCCLLLNISLLQEPCDHTDPHGMSIHFKTTKNFRVPFAV